MGGQGIGHLLTEDVEVVVVSNWNLGVQVWVRGMGGKGSRGRGNLERRGRLGEGGGKKNWKRRGRGKGGSKEGRGERCVGDGGNATGGVAKGR